MIYIVSNLNVLVNYIYVSQNKTYNIFADLFFIYSDTCLSSIPSTPHKRELNTYL